MSDDFTRMRFTWLDQVHDDKSLAATTMAIAYHLSRFFNRLNFSRDGIFTAWPSHQTLAERAGKDVSTIRRAIDQLKKGGHLATKGQGGRNCSLKYLPIISGGGCNLEAETEVEELPKPAHFCAPLEKDDEYGSEKVLNPARKPAHSCAENVLKNEQLTSLKKNSLKNLSEPGEETSVEYSKHPSRAPIGTIVLSLLALGPSVSIPPLPPFLRGKEDIYPELVADHQAQHGWPDLLERCHDLSLQSLPLARLALEMESVADGSDEWLAWRDEYRRRGWPMPSPLLGLACFPECGPDRLDAFLERLKAAALDRSIDQAGNVARLADRRAANG